MNMEKILVKYEGKVPSIITQDEANKIVDKYGIFEDVYTTCYEFQCRIFIDLRDGQIWSVYGYADYESPFIIEIISKKAFEDWYSLDEVLRDNSEFQEFQAFYEEYKEWKDYDEDDEDDEGIEEITWDYNFDELDEYCDVYDAYCYLVLEEYPDDVLEYENGLCFEAEFEPTELSEFYSDLVELEIEKDYTLATGEKLHFEDQKSTFIINLPYIDKHVDMDYEELEILADDRCLEAYNTDNEHGTYVVIALEDSEIYNIKIGDLIPIEMKGEYRPKAILAELQDKY